MISWQFCHGGSCPLPLNTVLPLASWTLHSPAFLPASLAVLPPAVVSLCPLPLNGLDGTRTQSFDFFSIRIPSLEIPFKFTGVIVSSCLLTDLLSLARSSPDFTLTNPSAYLSSLLGYQTGISNLKGNKENSRYSPDTCSSCLFSILVYGSFTLPVARATILEPSFSPLFLSILYLICQQKLSVLLSYLSR